LLKKNSSVIVYCLPSKENKQTEVCYFPFPERKLLFSVFGMLEHGDMETWDMKMETWKYEDIDMRHGNMEKLRHETWRYGDIETWRHGDIETWRHRDMELKYEGILMFSEISQMENKRKPENFP
jgi:hypothetical protein